LAKHVAHVREKKCIQSFDGETWGPERVRRRRQRRKYNIKIDLTEIGFRPWSRSEFLNRRAAARYRALASIIPGRERFSWNLSF